MTIVTVDGEASKRKQAAAGLGLVLSTLAAAQFLMTLDSSVMNVSIATVAHDVGTTVTGIQGAITAYTLVMACLMLTGAKVGGLIGRRRAFAIGLVIYAAGSLTTAVSSSLPVLLLGWSLLEGIGAALILPAIVALVAANFPRERRAYAYGLVAAAGAIAVAVGPLIGGLATTYLSWRWVFFGEVAIAATILILSRGQTEDPIGRRPRLDVVGSVLSAAGLGLVVFGVLRSGIWGWVDPKPGAPTLGGVSAVTWLVLTGGLVLWLFFRWQDRRDRQGRDVLVAPAMLANRKLRGGLLMFFFQYLVQAGVFFVVPIYLSIALGLSAVATGIRVMPLSVTLLLTAVGVPRVFPHVSPRLIVRLGLLALLLGTLVLMWKLSPTSGPAIVIVPMLLIGAGIGMLASQLGSVTVSSVPDDKSPEVGGLQNTVTNLGASLGTALAGSLLIATLSSSFLTAIAHDPAVPQRVSSNAAVKLAGGVPFISDASLESALTDAHVPPRQRDAAMSSYRGARVEGLKAALALLALITVVALFAAQLITTRQPGSDP